MATDEKVIKDAQYRKGLSIAFFNATNSAITLVAQELANRGDPSVSEEHILTRVNFYRDYFLEQHKNYYASVIANVGQNYKAEDSIAKLKATKTLEELQIAWRLLSADERKDVEIKKVAQDLQKKYKTNEKV